MRNLGRTGLRVSPICVGTSPLASMPFLYGYAVTEEQAIATVDAVFDTTKIRTFVPGFAPRLTFHRAAARMVQWRRDHPDTTKTDASTEAVLARIVGAYHDARDVYAARRAS